MSTFGYRLVHRGERTVVLFLHLVLPPDDDTWKAAMTEIEGHTKRKNGNLSNFGFLVITDGGAPSMLQRTSMAAATAKQKYPLAVVSASKLHRGVITAISWLNPGIRGFEPTEWKDAVRHAGLPEGAVIDMCNEMFALQQKVGNEVKALKQVLDATTEYSPP